MEGDIKKDSKGEPQVPETKSHKNKETKSQRIEKGFSNRFVFLTDLVREVEILSMMTRPMYKQFRSPQGWYSLLFPTTWEQMVVEEIPAFFHPDAGGALQVYAFESKQEDFDVNLELSNYLKIHEIDYDEDKVAVFENNEGSHIRACEFIKEERYWFVYVIANRTKMILATYNSDEDLSDERFQELTNIISSVRFISG